jgi:hypothetical protein
VRNLRKDILFPAGNKKDRAMNTRKFGIGICVFLLVLVSAVAVSAAGVIPDDCLDSAVVDGNTICFMGKVDNTGGTTTWTYGVQKTEALPANGLSHIVLAICVDDPSAVVPGDGDSYTTPGLYGDFVGRAGIVYSVNIGFDPTTGVNGIKYEGGSPLSTGDVDIFQFTQPTQTNPGTELNDIGFKTGIGGSIGSVVSLQGPICGTSAVELTSFRAQSMSLFGRLLQWLGLR